MPMPMPGTGNVTDEKKGTDKEKAAPAPMMPDKEKMKKKPAASG